MFTFFRKYQNSLCVKLWIIIFVCSLLSLTCFFVENKHQPSRDRQMEENHKAQKLIQLRIMKQRNDVTKNSINEISGNYAEVPVSEIHSGSIIDKEDNFDMREISTVEANNEFMNIDENSENLTNNIEELIENIPELKVSQLRDFPINVESEILPEHSSLFVATDSDEDMNAQTKSYEMLEITNTPLDDTIFNWSPSDGRFFPNEHAFDSVDPSLENISEELILTSDDKGDYIEIDQMPDSRNIDLPVLLNTLLGRMSPLLSAMSPMPDFMVMTPKHLQDFKESSYKGNHLSLASAKVLNREKPSLEKFINSKIVFSTFDKQTKPH